MPEQLWFTEILNHLFAGPVTGLLRALHIDPQYPQAPITNAVAMQLLVFLFLVLLFCPGALAAFGGQSGRVCSTFSKALTASSRARATRLSDTQRSVHALS